MTPLPSGYMARPFAHRALHGTEGAENSMGAIKAAIAAGWSIEIDVQPSGDGHAMVFHDSKLDRLTYETGPITGHSAKVLTDMPLRGGGGTIPTFVEVLKIIDGRVPVMIEIKDQDGQMGPNLSSLEEALAADLKGYKGQVAVMSFNPHAVARMAELCPDIPRGLVTSAYHTEHWPNLAADVRKRLAAIPDFDRVGASFISHEVAALEMPRVAELKALGVPIQCWTVRSAEQEAQAREIVDQITFEGYTPA